MKGIEAIIAVILLLLITIAVVGFAFIFFSRITSSAGAAAENQTAAQTAQFSKRVSVDNFNATLVAIRNSGSAAVGPSEIQIYVNGAPRTCTPALTVITPGSVQVCNFVPACNPGSTLRLTAPGSSIDTNC